mgnify:CR=1 FL=1|jgi:acyl carrier protein
MSLKNKEIVLNYLKSISDVEISDNTHLQNNGILDSMGIFEFIEYIQSSFGIEIDAEDILEENFSTVAAVLKFINSKEKS